MRRFLDQPVWVRVIRGILLAAAVAAVAFYTPTPYLLEAPGRTVPVSDIIKIADQQAHPVNGQFLMATILVEKASVMLCLYGLLDPDATLTRTSPEAVGEQAQSPHDSQQMGFSQYLSTRAALEKLGYQVRGQYLGLLIVNLDQASPNLDRLKPGDLIVELAGRKAPTLEDFNDLIRSETAQKKLAVVIERAGKRFPLQLDVVMLRGRMRIGVLFRPEYDDIKLPVEIHFQSGNTSGASAGLVFALEIYDQLSPVDLGKGRIIAATGTIDGQGRVGGIEGLPFKLIGVERAHADVFLVPRENWHEIKNIATKVKVIPVATLQEAIDALQ